MVLMPSLAVLPVPNWNSTELPMVDLPVQIGRKLTVAGPGHVACWCQIRGRAVRTLRVSSCSRAGCRGRGEDKGRGGQSPDCLRVPSLQRVRHSEQHYARLLSLALCLHPQPARLPRSEQLWWQAMAAGRA